LVNFEVCLRTFGNFKEILSVRNRRLRALQRAHGRARALLWHSIDIGLVTLGKVWLSWFSETSITVKLIHFPIDH